MTFHMKNIYAQSYIGRTKFRLPKHSDCPFLVNKYGKSFSVKNCPKWKKCTNLSDTSSWIKVLLHTLIYVTLNFNTLI